MSIELNFSLGREEYYDALQFYRQKRGLAASDRVAGGLLVLLGGALWLVTGNGLWGAVFLLGGLAVAWLSAPLRKMLFASKWRREPLFHAEQLITVAEEGVFFRLGQFDSNLPWSYYESYLESPAGFLMIYGEAFNFFPKRSFTSEQALGQFRELIAKKLKPHNIKCANCRREVKND